MGGGVSVGINKLTQQEIQTAYASSVLNQMQNCGAIPSDANIIEIEGDFNSVTGINQYINDGSQMDCVFQASTQQTLQDNLVAELTAQAQSKSQAPTSLFVGPLGLFGGLMEGALVNDTTVNVSDIQNSVASIVTSQVQNCNQSSCNTAQAGAVSPPSSALRQEKQVQSFFLGSPSTSCAGSCTSSNCVTAPCAGGANNVLCIDGNFNSVSDVSQNINMDWVRNCMYAPQVTANVTNSLQSALNTVSEQAQTNGLSGFGWVIYVLMLFVLLGLLFLAARFLYREYNTNK